MNSEIREYGSLITEYAKQNYRKMFREPDGLLKYKFIVPGSGYTNSLWDWDSWLTDIALRQLNGEDDISEYEKGCILNFIDFVDKDGRVPISIMPDHTIPKFVEGVETNIHKPCLAQHALFVCEQIGDFEWLKDGSANMERYIGFYINKCKHESGLYYWIDDCAIGVDNDPCTFYRPKCSSGSIYLNCLMFKELEAMALISEKLGFTEKAELYKAGAEELKLAVREHCWDERDGFYYSVDLNLLPINPDSWLHRGCPRHWNLLIQRIGVWSGFLAMWAGIATKEQAERMVNEHYFNKDTFNAPYGIRTLSKLEKMYLITKSGNPSDWLGPIWGISNYMTFEGLKNYGFNDAAKELAEKTITLFGRDIKQNGEPHEYYDPETGEGITHPGFQNWNLLSIKMADWLNKNDIE